MNSREFVIKEIYVLIKRIPIIKVRYEFDPKVLTHIIEIVPKEVYHFDEEYISWENNVYERFDHLFPNESICFVSDDSLVGVEKPIVVFNYSKEKQGVGVLSEL